MAAQPGEAILLQYGPQGLQQNGGLVILDSAQQNVATTRTLVARRTGIWGGATLQPADTKAPYASANESDLEKKNPWVASEGVAKDEKAPWAEPVIVDTQRASAWGKLAYMPMEDRLSTWYATRSADDNRRAAWGAFGDMLNVDESARWYGSRRADAERATRWAGIIVNAWRDVPYVRPAGAASNFGVIGGGVDFFIDLSGGAYVPPAALDLQLAGGAYSAPIVDYPALDYLRPTGNKALFQLNRTRELRLDAFGQPIFDYGVINTDRTGVWGEARPKQREIVGLWTRYSKQLSSSVDVVVPPTPGVVPGQQIIIPVQRVYIVTNEIQLTRVSGVAPITTLSLNISFDCDSWVPSFTATIPESARSLIMPDPSPVEVQAAINGTLFHFFVERIGRSRQFGQNAITIGGRGIACELDAPYAVASQHTYDTNKTAQQIIQDALGFSTYTQTWGITDWLVPANTYSIYGTPITVAQDVAAASGSVLQADWEARDLRMMARYPVKPWDWATATPDIIIPGAVAQSESLEWVEKPSYNVVYVSGEQNGILGHVKITGTAGDLPAQMITHPLITHQDAARQRGISVLSDTGRKTNMQISLPVLDSTGIIDVCKLIEFNDGATTRRGIVRANNINVSWPTVRQTLTIEAAA